MLFALGTVRLCPAELALTLERPNAEIVCKTLASRVRGLLEVRGNLCVQECPEMHNGLYLTLHVVLSFYNALLNLQGVL